MHSSSQIRGHIANNLREQMTKCSAGGSKLSTLGTQHRFIHPLQKKHRMRLNIHPVLCQEPGPLYEPPLDNVKLLTQNLVIMRSTM